MSPLDQFESDQKMLNELKDMFEFASPAKIRRNLEDLFFTHLTSNEPSLPNEQELIKSIYYLINFFNEVESQKRF
ncbi:hypothetical protein [Ekhidna sp. To15]|uniref:hypothetical protein n=1 Tax=Ekhidna sp. To15 TaxID=3395267 RepID=UPI003F524E70